MTTSNQKLLVTIINDNHRELLTKLIFRYGYGLEATESVINPSKILFHKFRRLVQFDPDEQSTLKSTESVDSGQLRQILNWLESDYVAPVKKTVRDIIVTADEGKIKIQKEEITKADLEAILNEFKDVDIGENNLTPNAK